MNFRRSLQVPFLSKGVITISLKKYMFYDLGMLAIIGVVIEMVGVYVSDTMFSGTFTTFCFSVLIMIVALSRWGIKGLLISPFLALSTFVCGKFLIAHSGYRELYDGTVLLAIFLSLVSISTILIWFKIFGSKRILGNMGLTLLLCLYVIALVIGVQTLTYWIFNNGITISVFLIIYNGLGIIFTFVGAGLLRQQQVLVNVKQKILDDKKQRELDLEYEKQFSAELFSNSSSDSTKNSEKKEN